MDDGMVGVSYTDLALDNSRMRRSGASSIKAAFLGSLRSDSQICLSPRCQYPLALHWVQDVLLVVTVGHRGGGAWMRPASRRLVSSRPSYLAM